MRAIAPGGHIIVYAPNRLFPFETHGIYIGDRFIFGNIPFVNWLPTAVRNRLVPHARAYTKSGIRRTYTRLGANVRAETYVYPGFDNIIARRKRLGAFPACGAVPRRAHAAADVRPLAFRRAAEAEHGEKAAVAGRRLGGSIGETPGDAPRHPRAPSARAAIPRRQLRALASALRRASRAGAHRACGRRRRGLRRVPLIRQRPGAAGRSDRQPTIRRRADLRPARQPAVRVRRRPLRPARRR